MKKRNENDVIELILEDHLVLKTHLEDMKNPKLDLESRRSALEDFAILLLSHSTPEERVVYDYMKLNTELRRPDFHGESEHKRAIELAEAAEQETDAKKFSAHIRALARLMESHLRIEETEILPLFMKNTDLEQRRLMGERFLELKARILSQDLDDALQIDPDEDDDLDFDDMSRAGVVQY